MLAAPEFDAYNCIGRYAEDPKSYSNIQALAWLKRTVHISYLWKSLLGVGPDTAEAATELRLGQRDYNMRHGPAGLTAQALTQMSSEDRDDLYISLCKQAGVDITKDMLLKSRETNE